MTGPTQPKASGAEINGPKCRSTSDRERTQTAGQR